MFSYTNARCSIMNDYKSWFISQDWDYSMSWLRSLFSSDIGSLSCLGSNNSNRFHIIFTVEWNFDAQILQKLKIYRKIRIKQCQYCFANIPARMLGSL